MFWYEDATVDPVGWHLQWMKFSGVQLPFTIVTNMAQAAVGASWRLVNEHPGGKQWSANRTWEHEVGVDVVKSANEILRNFLPPVLLARWGVVE